MINSLGAQRLRDRGECGSLAWSRTSSHRSHAYTNHLCATDRRVTWTKWIEIALLLYFVAADLARDPTAPDDDSEEGD